ncbi:MAG: transglycosylase SLT domain-containing protein [Mariniphaga sp.]
MWKNKVTLLLILAVLFSIQDVSAQWFRKKKKKIAPIEMIEPNLLQPDTMAIVPKDSMINVELEDTLLYEVDSMPDENLNDIFSVQIDSMANSSYIRELFHFDITEIDTSDNYPINIPDSVYIARLQNIQEVIPLSYNKTVKNIIRFYTERRRDQVEMMLGLSAYYFPIFEEVLDRYEMPLELKYLPVIESALNPRATSPVGANGLWQFMYGTGKQMGLEISSFIDERRDPMKATDAAIRYLNYLYNIYDDWYLAIAAYNCGPGNVNRAIRRSGNRRNYWEIYYRLPRETRGYVPAFIAAAYIMNYYRDHNLIPQMPEIPFQTDTMFVHDYLHFNQLAENLDMEKEQIQALNPMYRRDVVPAKAEKPYPLTLPHDKILEFLDKDSVIFAYQRNKYFPNNSLAGPSSSSSYFTPADVAGKEEVTYTVKSGDNLGYIAEWFRVRLSELRYWNNIRGNLIRVGQRLTIYVPAGQQEYFSQFNSMSFAQKQASLGKTPVTSAASASSGSGAYEYYTVKRGDTVWDIAGRYPGVTPQQILRLNNLTNRSSLAIGQKLRIRVKKDT